jgi:hypothetical protein
MTAGHDTHRSAQALILAVHRNDAELITSLWNVLSDEERLELAIATAAEALDCTRAALGNSDDEKLGDFLRYSVAELAQAPDTRDAR